MVKIVIWFWRTNKGAIIQRSYATLKFVNDMNSIIFTHVNITIWLLISSSCAKYKGTLVHSHNYFDKILIITQFIASSLVFNSGAGIVEIVISCRSPSSSFAWRSFSMVVATFIITAITSGRIPRAESILFLLHNDYLLLEDCYLAQTLKNISFNRFLIGTKELSSVWRVSRIRFFKWQNNNWNLTQNWSF